MFSGFWDFTSLMPSLRTKLDKSQADNPPLDKGL
jgi:hypothetical protein